MKRKDNDIKGTHMAYDWTYMYVISMYVYDLRRI